MTRRKRRPIPHAIRFYVLRRDKFTCQYCGRKAPDVVLHIDHIKAVAHGGSNHPNNLLVACVGCNVGKGTEGIDSHEERTPTLKEDLLARELHFLRLNVVGAIGVSIASVAEKSVLMRLGIEADFLGSVQLPVSVVADECAVSEQDVRRAVRGFEAVGLLGPDEEGDVIIDGDDGPRVACMLRLDRVSKAGRPPFTLADYWEPDYFSPVERIHG